MGNRGKADTHIEVCRVAQLQAVTSVADHLAQVEQLCGLIGGHIHQLPDLRRQLRKSCQQLSTLFLYAQTFMGAVVDRRANGEQI